MSGMYMGGSLEDVEMETETVPMTAVVTGNLRCLLSSVASPRTSLDITLPRRQTPNSIHRLL